VVTKTRSKDPYLSIQEDKKRFGGFIIVFMEIQLVTVVTGENQVVAPGGVACLKLRR